MSHVRGHSFQSFFPGHVSEAQLSEDVWVPVASLVQENGLEWNHRGRNGADSILSEDSHRAIMRHNFSNVR